MRACQRWDMYLYLASSWSGLWLCVFLVSLLNDKNRLFCVDRRLWDSAVCPLLIVFISSSFPKQQAGYSGPLWDTESHWQRGHPSSTCCICLYLLLLQYPHISFHSLACFSSASFLSYETHCSLLWDGISSLWVQTAIHREIDGNSSKWSL